MHEQENKLTWHSSSCTPNTFFNTHCVLSCSAKKLDKQELVEMDMYVVIEWVWLFVVFLFLQEL